jgi:ABC-2 type transport system ATP-binding protein
MSESVPAIEVQNLSHSYKNQRALVGATFSVTQQSIHGFVGPNGAGKTTALKILATLLKPQVGVARIFGHDLARDYKEVRRHVGFMPDHLGMYRQMTVQEYLDFFSAAYGMTHAERERVIKDVLALTDMEGRKDDFIKSLSQGMKQRVALARVLVHDPKLLLLDEPASGLDPRARIELMDILRELRRMGKTIFISSHILTELATLCDHVTILDRGCVKYTGLMEGLLGRNGDSTSYVIALNAAHPPLVEALRQLPGVLGVAQMEEQPKYRVEFDETQVNTNAILQMAMASGAQIVSFTEYSRHLNEAFMDLTEPGVAPSSPAPPLIPPLFRPQPPAPAPKPPPPPAPKPTFPPDY